MKKYRLIKYTLILITLIGIACEESFEEVSLSQNDDYSLEKSYNLNTLSLKEITLISDFFESKTKKGIFTAKNED